MIRNYTIELRPNGKSRKTKTPERSVAQVMMELRDTTTHGSTGPGAPGSSVLRRGQEVVAGSSQHRDAPNRASGPSRNAVRSRFGNIVRLRDNSRSRASQAQPGIDRDWGHPPLDSVA